MEEFAIKVKNLYKNFKIFHEKRNSLFESAASIFDRKKHYETLTVLDDISFEIKKGEIFGIIGKNGMGKTTLLRLISGIYKPDSGKITVNGSIIPFLGLGAGFQAEMTARDNVMLYGKILGMQRDMLQANVDKIMQFAELEKFEDTKLKNFSAGMYARLAFATAVNVDPDIILMDEILAVGDIGFQRKCYDTFESYKKREKTIVLVSHDLNSIEQNCERSMLLDNGKIKEIGDTKAVTKKYNELFEN